MQSTSIYRKLIIILLIPFALSFISPQVLAQVTLSISVPSPVQILIDGREHGPGLIVLPLTAGSHSLVTPQYVSLTNQSRLRFDEWSDGSRSLNRTINLVSNVSLAVSYVTQYRLKIISYFNATGAGWYDAGSTATFSTVASPQPMSSINQPFGGQWIFSGWYDNHTLVSNSSEGSILMDEPHTLIAGWYADYNSSQLSEIIVAIASSGAIILVAGTLLYASRRSKKKAKSRRKIRR